MPRAWLNIPREAMHWQFGEMEFGEMKRNTSNWSNFCMLLLRAGLTASAGLSCFWRYWALSILQYPSRKRTVFSVRGGSDLRKWRGAPGGCVTPLFKGHCHCPGYAKRKVAKAKVTRDGVWWRCHLYTGEGLCPSRKKNAMEYLALPHNSYFPVSYTHLTLPTNREV